MSALPEQPAIEQQLPTEPTEKPLESLPPQQNGGALFDFLTGKQTLDPKAAADEAEKKIVATKDEIKKIEEEIAAKQIELLNKRNEITHLEQDLKRQRANIGALLYTKGGKKTKKSKKSNKKSSRKTR